jgi:hypothetical protein
MAANSGGIPLTVEVFSVDVAELLTSCERAISSGTRKVIKTAIASKNSLLGSLFWLNQNIKKFMTIYLLKGLLVEIGVLAAALLGTA